MFDGRTSRSSDKGAVVMHLELPPDQRAHVDIVNPFTQGTGDVITSLEKGFSAGAVLINGGEANLAEYISRRGIDVRLPLVANYIGTMINVTLQAVDVETGRVSFYAPVFTDTEYRFAAPVTDCAHAFSKLVDQLEIDPVFSCNCVLNFQHGNLEGRKTGRIVGPMTFGEIAYGLLNQTLVHLSLSRKAQ